MRWSRLFDRDLKDCMGKSISAVTLLALNLAFAAAGAVTAALLLFMLVTAFLQPAGVRRALALFLVAYCLVSSFTETGLSDASLYLLDLSVAASLLVPPITNRSPG